MKNQKEDFGIIGLKIGDIIQFNPTGKKYMVASGNGTPENGGTLVVEDNENESSNSEQFHTSPLPDESSGEQDSFPPSRKGTLKTSILFVNGKELMSLGVATRRLLMKNYNNQTDIWNYWSHEGRNLRGLFNDKLETNNLK